MLNKQLLKACLFLVLIIGAPIIRAQENVVYRSSVNLTDPAEKILALQKFIRDYPESNYIAGADYYLFDAYMQLNKVDSALIYASNYVNAYPEGGRIGPYNDVASLLVEKKAGMDTADVYTRKALEMARAQNSRGLAEVMDTRACVLNLLGKPDSALSLEQEAIKGNENNPDLLNHIAVFEFGSGNKTAAFQYAAKAILNGNTDEALTNFNKWSKDLGKDGKNAAAVKDSLIKNILNDYLSNSKSENKNIKQSTAAVFLANTSVDLSEATKLAKEALNSLTKSSSLDDKVSFTKNYSIVLAAYGKNKEAIKEMNSIEDLVDPWDTDFWYTLGKAYEKVGEKKKAEDTFISGLIAYESPKLINALKDLSSGKNFDVKALQKKIEAEKEQLAKFEPGRFKKSKEYKGNVVLAELFTGAECPPCAGADYAYDALSEFYPRSVVAILAYHVHIPAPDPMTNPQTFRRYMYYGGNFGTPTAFIEGTEKIVGGGPKFLVKNRFHVYQYAINKFLQRKPSAELTGAASLVNDNVKINLEAKTYGSLDKDVTLHIALAEKSVEYPGGNGVNKNIFVVRDLIGGAEGIPVELTNNVMKTEQTIDVGKVEQGLTEYLNDPSKDISWRRNARFNGWRQRTDKINRNNLAIVTWLQNNLTKEIIQADYMDVKK